MYGRHRLVASLGGIVCAAALVVAPTAAQAAEPGSSAIAACQASILRTLPNATDTDVVGGDHSGRFLVGQVLTFDGERYTFRPIMWVDRKPVIVDTTGLAPDAQINATDVNSRGTVVGYQWPGQTVNGFRAWKYQDGRITVLRGLSATEETQAVAINSRGDIFGTSEDRYATPPVARLVIWPGGDPDRPRELTVAGTPAGWSRARDLSDEGFALGEVMTASGERQPYVWPVSGPPFRLSVPAGYLFYEVRGLSGYWVVGTLLTTGHATDHSVAARWNLLTGKVEIVSPEPSVGMAVNRLGTASIYEAVIHRNGRVSAIDGFATVLDDRGGAAGTDAEGEFWSGHAVVWTGC